MPNKINKFIYWTPRILSILFIAFLAMFSLDIFDGNYGFWGTILGLFMHNIPAIILSIILWISWKREIVGGIVFILAGFLYVGMILAKTFDNQAGWYMLFWTLLISGSAFLIGALFLIGWRRKKTKETKLTVDNF